MVIFPEHDNWRTKVWWKELSVAQLHPILRSFRDEWGPQSRRLAPLLASGTQALIVVGTESPESPNQVTTLRDGLSSVATICEECPFHKHKQTTRSISYWRELWLLQRTENPMCSLGTFHAAFG